MEEKESERNKNTEKKIAKRVTEKRDRKWRGLASNPLTLIGQSV